MVPCFNYIVINILNGTIVNEMSPSFSYYVTNMLDGDISLSCMHAYVSKKTPKKMIFLSFC
ncbi:MAG: hypothetical protein K2J02_02355, partial [Malacoplasma sp.]|nr:hypothetical protein [Malacoplasma sp.]